MARKKKPIPSRVLEADHATVRALESLPDYQPINPALNIAQLKQLQAIVTSDEQNINQILAVLDEARNRRADNSHHYHGFVVAARAHVVVQYGADSPVVENIGLTRTSNRKHPSRHKP